jgi:hypothetical protein
MTVAKGNKTELTAEQVAEQKKLEDDAELARMEKEEAEQLKAIDEAAELKVIEEAALDQEKVEAVSEFKIGEKVSLRATFGGPMNNPRTGDMFTGESSKPIKIDDWIISQLEAGKLSVVVED